MNEKKKCPFCGEEIMATAQKCRYCGEWLNKGQVAIEKKKVPCPICGEQIEEGIEICPCCHERIAKKNAPINTERTAMPTDYGNIGTNHCPSVVQIMTGKKTWSYFDYYFFNPIIKHCVDFTGTISRKQYWMSFLYMIIFAFIILFIYGVILDAFALSDDKYNLIDYLLYIFLAISNIANSIRRLRDASYDWTTLFYNLIPIIGAIIIITRLAESGEKEEEPVKFNKYDIIALVTTLIIVIVSFAAISNTNSRQQKLIDLENCSSDSAYLGNDTVSSNENDTIITNDADSAYKY